MWGTAEISKGSRPVSGLAQVRRRVQVMPRPCQAPLPDARLASGGLNLVASLWRVAGIENIDGRLRRFQDAESAKRGRDILQAGLGYLQLATERHQLIAVIIIGLGDDRRVLLGGRAQDVDGRPAICLVVEPVDGVR